MKRRALLRISCFILILVVLLLGVSKFSTQIKGEDYVSGLNLYEQYCSKCHGSIDLEDPTSWVDPLDFSSKIKELAESNVPLEDYFQEKHGLSFSEYISEKMAPFTGHEFTEEEIQDLIALFQYVYKAYLPQTTTTETTETTTTPQTTPQTTAQPVNYTMPQVITVTETVKIVETKTKTATITLTTTTVQTETETFIVEKTETIVSPGVLELTSLVIVVAVIVSLSVVIAGWRS